MASVKDMLKALKRAKTYVDNSMLKTGKEDENSFEDNIWHVAAELEYALFFASMLVQDETTKSEWKPDPELKKAGVESIVTVVRDLVAEAEKCTESSKLLEAYRHAYVARDCVLKIQKDLEKERRKALKKK